MLKAAIPSLRLIVLVVLVVLDPGIETLITGSLATKLNIAGPSFHVRFGNFNDSVTIESKIVSFCITSFGLEVPVTEAFLVPRISLSPRRINWPVLKKNWSHLADLNLPAIDSSNVEVLIGANQISAHIQ